MATEDASIDIKAALLDFKKEFTTKITALKEEGLIEKGQFNDALARLTKLDESHEGFQTRLKQLELRGNRPGLAGKGHESSLGKALTESESYKSFVSRDCRRMDAPAKLKGLSLKALSSAAGAGGDAIDPFRRMEMVENRTRPLRLIDLLTVIEADRGSMDYVEEKYWHELEAEITTQAASTQADVIVENSYGFYPGQTVYLARGAAAEETKVVDSIDHDTKTITLTTNLANTHAVGIKVTSDTFVFTPETKLSPLAGMETELKTGTAKILKAGIAISKQLAKDAPALARYVDARLPMGVELQFERQVLSGDGSSEQFQGLLTHSSIQTVNWSNGNTGDTKYDTIRHAMTLATLAFYPVEAVVLHPTDWDEMETAKGVDGHYLLMHAGNGAESGPWRLPIVETPVISYGTACLGAFSMACTVWDVDEMEVMVFDQHKDYAAKGLLYVQAEKRAIFTIERPISIVKVTFDNAPA